MKIQALKGILLVIGFFLLVYVPTFAIVGFIKPGIVVAVPLTIVISFVLAISIIAIQVLISGSWREYGFRLGERRYILAAIVVGVPLGLVLTFIDKSLSPGDPLGIGHLKLWMLIVYFLIGSSIQEEVVFRGLLQTVLAKHLNLELGVAGKTLSLAALLIALLFGLIHLEVGPFTAFAAFLLAVLAGELRHRSGSLVPAILVHTIFNACGLLWMLK